MNASSWQAVWLLAVEVAAVVGLTWLVAWRLRSVVWQRTLWQASLIAIAGLLVMEFAALTPDFMRKEVQADTPVLEIKAEAMEVSTPENAPAEIAATELSITIPTEPLVSLEPVAAMAPVNQEVVLTADRLTVIKETKAEEAAVKSSADKFPLGLALLLLVWTVGSLVLAGRLLVGRFLLLRFCARSRVVADERLCERVQGIARKLGLKQGVQVLETGRIQTPVVFGLVRLTIALPVGFTERFERRQQEAILAHELAHLAARDPLWYLLADALVSVLWWHPLVWVARARLQVTSEMAADEACVLAKHGPETLAECLVTIAQEMHGQGALESIGIEGSGFRSRLGQRVERLLKLSAEVVSRPAAWRTRLVKVGMPVMLVGVLLVGSGWVRKDQSAPWSGLMSGAWKEAVGVLRVEEADIRREPRPVLVVAQAEKLNVESDGRAEKALEPLVSQVFTLKHAVPTEIVAAVGTAITDSLGKIVADDRAKKLLVNAVKGDMKNVEEIIAKLDVSGGKIEGAVQATNTVFNYDKDGILLRREEERKKLNQAVEAEEKEFRLNGIKLAKVSLKNVTLEEAVKRLNSNSGLQANGITVGLEGKMATTMGNIELGLVICSAEIEQWASLRQALDAVCKGAVYPLRYQLQGNKVVFQAKQAEVVTTDTAKGDRAASVQKAEPEKDEISKVVSDAKQVNEQNRLSATEDKLKKAKAKATPTMFTTVFKFDPEAFVRGAEKITGKKASDLTNIRTTEAELVQMMARLLFASEGANMEASTEAGAQVQLGFMDRTGDFFVRAAMEDRERIMKAVEKASAAGTREVETPVKELVYRPNGQTNLYIRIGKVETNSFFKELEKKTGEKLDLKVEGDAGHYSYSSVNLHSLLQKYFAVAGLVCEVSGPDAGGTRVSFNPALGYLWVRGTPDEVEIARKLVQPFLTATLPVPNASVRTNAVLTGRQRNLVKLDQIVLKEVLFDDKPLSEVVMFLTEEARRLDPEKKGINFIINSNLDDQPGRSQVDSRGLTLTPVPNPNRSAVDLEKMRIKINPPLKNLRLVDALDAITKVATPPVDGVGLSFVVEDHAVVFRQRVVDPAQLFTRVYKLDTNKLMSLLEKETEGKVTPLRTNVTASGQANVVWTVPTNTTIGPGDKLSVMVRQYLAGRGVSLAAAEAGGVNTQIFFNDRTGVLMVRCTRQDLEIIETALENLGAIEKVMPTPNPLGAAASAGTNEVSKLLQEAKTPGKEPAQSQNGKVQDVEKLPKATKLDVIKLPKTSVRGLSLGDIIYKLEKTIKSMGDTNNDLSIRTLGNVETPAGALNVLLVTINAEITEGMSLRRALDLICEGSAYPVQYRLSGDYVVFEAKSNQVEAASAPKTPAEMKQEEANEKVLKLLQGKAEVAILVMEGKSLYEKNQRDEAESKFREVIKRDPANTNAFHYLNLIQEARYGDLAKKRDAEQRARLVEIEKAWEVPKARDGLPTPNPYVQTNVARTLTKAQQRIESKLDQMVIKEVFFDGLPLSEVVRFLREESAKLDPEKVGINFVINSKLDDQPGGEGGKALRDPLGAPLAPVVNPGAQELNMVLVTINPPLKNLTMREMLSAITNATAQVGKHGLDYRVEDFGVTFRQRVIEPPQLFTRIFKIETNAFVKNLEKRMGMAVDAVMLNPDELPKTSGTNQTAGSSQNLRTFQVQKLARAFFVKEGVNISLKGGTNAAETQIFFNDRTGVLMVRAALEDLEIIQNVIARMSAEDKVEEEANGKGEFSRVIAIEPWTVIYWLHDKKLLGTNVSARAVEGGLVRYLSRELIQPVNAADGNGPKVALDMEKKRVTVRGTLKDLQIMESAVQVLGLIPAQVLVEAKYFEVSDKAAKEMGLNWFTGGPLSGTNMGKAVQFLNASIPTHENVRVEAPVLPNYVSVLSPVQARELVKRFEQKDGCDILSSPRMTTVNNRQARIDVVNQKNITVAKKTNPGAGEKGEGQTEFVVNPVMTGPSLEVMPSVLHDGRSMQMTWMFCLTEFLGYDKPGKEQEKNEPLPRFRVRQVGNTSALLDGQTLIFGAGSVEKTEAKTGLFRAKPKTETRHIIVMLTPTVVDPAGNRVNRE